MGLPNGTRAIVAESEPRVTLAQSSFRAAFLYHVVASIVLHMSSTLTSATRELAAPFWSITEKPRRIRPRPWLQLQGRPRPRHVVSGVPRAALVFQGLGGIGTLVSSWIEYVWFWFTPAQESCPYFHASETPRQIPVWPAS